jgi:hypothetical protein
MAVMQACIAAVNSGKRVSMVLSGKMVWFIQLKVENGDCYVDIANRRRVDGKGILMDLVRLIQYSKNDEGLSEDEKDAWDGALEAIDQDESSDDEEAQPKKPLGKHARSDSKDGSPPDSSHPSQGGTDAASGPARTLSTDQSNADFKLQRKDNSQLARGGSFAVEGFGSVCPRRPSLTLYYLRLVYVKNVIV